MRVWGGEEDGFFSTSLDNNNNNGKSNNNVMQNIDAINCLKAIGSQIMRENKEGQVIILFTSSSQKEQRILRSHNSTTESLYVFTESIYRRCTSSLLFFAQKFQHKNR